MNYFFNNKRQYVQKAECIYHAIINLNFLVSKMQDESIFQYICGNILHWFAPPISQQILCGPPNEITLNKCPCLYFIPLSYLRHYTILSIHTAKEKFIFPLIYKGLLSRAKECCVDKWLWLYQHYKCSCLHVNLRCDKKKDITHNYIKGKIT